MESESENLKFKQKCLDLQKRILEIDENNETVTIAISRTKNSISRLRLEYGILLERLEKKALSQNATSDEIYKKLLTSPELPSLKLTELNPSKRKVNGKQVKPKQQKERDPNLPKRPTNSYLIFCDLEKEHVKKKFEEIHNVTPGLVDMSRALTEAWRNLTEQDKKPYFKLYEDDKERYGRELAKYNLQKQKDETETEKEELQENGVLPPGIRKHHLSDLLASEPKRVKLEGEDEEEEDDRESVGGSSVSAIPTSPE